MFEYRNFRTLTIQFFTTLLSWSILVSCSHAIDDIDYCRPFSDKDNLSAEKALEYAGYCKKEKKYDDSIAYVKLSAHMGNAEGLYQLAKFYMNPLTFHGISVKDKRYFEDPIKHQRVKYPFKEAEKYFLRAYKKEHKEASWWLGNLYMGRPNSLSHLVRNDEIKEKINSRACAASDKYVNCILEAISEYKREKYTSVTFDKIYYPYGSVKINCNKSYKYFLDQTKHETKRSPYYVALLQEFGCDKRAIQSRKSYMDIYWMLGSKYKDVRAMYRWSENILKSEKETHENYKLALNTVRYIVSHSTHKETRDNASSLIKRCLNLNPEHVNSLPGCKRVNSDINS